MTTAQTEKQMPQIMLGMLAVAPEVVWQVGQPPFQSETSHLLLLIYILIQHGLKIAQTYHRRTEIIIIHRHHH